MIFKLLLLFTLFVSCDTKQIDFVDSINKNKTEIKNQTPEIQEITIKYFGGRSINDSTVYSIKKSSFEFHIYHKDKSKSSNILKKIDENTFNNLINSINLTEFKNIKNGKSFQETDGNDTEIRIKTKDETISKSNGFGNQNWDLIINFFNSFEYN
ncbi:hypothetical protein [Flavobacterium sp. I3-2]|uniref:hypothetical protein n=1 Tax=Flavobacterium sp. I3-2 TaxID=2748319 RepID=UPI0015B28D8F|nr:hypothetical protein [Flavobacterium sp. I3-2]